MSEDGENLQPRDHHYLFAHRVLPGLVFAEPSRFAQIMIGQGEAFLMQVWGMIPEQFGLAERVEPAGLGYSLALAEDATGMITVRLPPPRAVTEAHMVAVVFGPKDQDPARYFTLELGYSLDDRPRTVLGEWAQGGELHANFGDGPSPEEGAFRAAIARLIAGG